MVNPNAQYQYKKTTIQTSSRERLLLMLYSGLIRFLKQAITALEVKNYQEVNDLLKRSQDIIGELMGTLNMDYEVSHRLWALYDYFLRRLVEANVKKEREPMDEVLGMLNELQDTWSEAAGHLRSGERIERLNVQG